MSSERLGGKERVRELDPSADSHERRWRGKKKLQF
jgi:hypothetical protein